LLVRGLAEDYRRSAVVDQPEVSVGGAFGQALLSCLHRCETSMLKVARGLAVLGEPCEPSVMGRLVKLETERVIRALAALRATGVLDGGDFRDPAARAAVLDGMAPEERVALHATAAGILRHDGAPAVAVARQLLRAENAGATCGVTVLQEAAEQILLDGEVALALSYLRLASRAGEVDDSLRARTTTMLARAEWRIDPWAASRHIPVLTAALEAGHLPPRHVCTPVRWLLWLGRLDSAQDALRVVTTVADGQRRPSDLDRETESELYGVRQWRALAYPGAGDPLGYPVLTAPLELAPSAEPQRHAPTILRNVLSTDLRAQSLASAERILEECRLADDTFAPVCAALVSLLVGGALGSARVWCERLLTETPVQKSPTWQALLAALAAEVALRRGELASAETQAKQALATISRRSWGVVVGLPLGTLVQALTAMGRYDQAALHARLPVPEAMMRTPVGLHYLHARGRHHQATGRHQAAFEDFMSIGQLMTAWGLDHPGLLPWRGEAAVACLSLGRVDRARDLVTTQLDLLGPDETSIWATSVRVLAATGDPNSRPPLLIEAAHALEGGEQTLELAHVLGDLGRAYLAIGEPVHARATLDQAARLAQRCGAQPVVDRLNVELATTEPSDVESVVGPGPDALVVDRPPELSDAEQRVAVLAARGYTNRQIASKLYVTVSTVEQHLTRVYRKLHVRCRKELAVRLRPNGPDWV
jgi:DNA-binding CsgD family transcriptional regulator